MARWGVPVTLLLGASAIALIALVAVVRPCASDDSKEDALVSVSPGLVPHLVIYRKQGAGAVRLHDGAVTRSGDIVQVSYVGAGNKHGVVLSIDGSGAVTLHFPLRPTDVSRIEPRGTHPLAHAFQLDDAPDFERFFFVTSALEPIDVDTVLRSAEMLTLLDPSTMVSGTLHLPASLTQSSILLRKTR